MKVRIQKAISSSGIASRRKAEMLVKEGRVTVNGQKITKPGILVDLEKDKIRVDGKLITRDNKKVYILLYKPRGYITSLEDPLERPKVIDLLTKVKVKVVPVGRLDFNAEGVLLLTNDGSLAQRLLHPRFGIPRTYLVKVKGFPDPKVIKKLRQGIQLSDGMTSPAKVNFLERTKKNSWIRITVKEGKNRLIKRMFAAVGHPVLKLKRIKFGPFSLGNLNPGEYRIISPEEIKKLIKI